MRAIVYEKYGPPSVLGLREVATPRPGDGEVLVAVQATTVSSGDTRRRALRVPRGLGLLSRLALGVFRPRERILGMELSGVVVEVGKGVTRWRVGARVFGAMEERAGAYVGFRVFREDGPLAEIPEGVTFEEAAALAFGGTTALDFFREGRLAAGERLLVNGASGAVGTAAVQLGKHLGAHVTAVCSAGNHALVRSLGADEVIDYREKDFAARGAEWDVILDAAGTAPWARSERALRPGGRLLVVLGGLGALLGAVWVNARRRRKVVVAGTAKVLREDVEKLAALAKEGTYRAVIDRTYEAEEIVAAHEYVDGGHKRGSVVVRMG